MIINFKIHEISWDIRKLVRKNLKILGGERDHSFVKEKALLVHLTNRKVQAKHFESYRT